MRLKETCLIAIATAMLCIFAQPVLANSAISVEPAYIHIWQDDEFTVNITVDPDKLLFSSDFSSDGSVDAIGVGDITIVGADEGVESIVGVWITVAVGVGLIVIVVGVCTVVVAVAVVVGGSDVSVGVCLIFILHVPLLTIVRIEPEREYNNSPSRSLRLSELTPQSPIA